MNGQSIFRAVAVIVLLVILAGVGVSLYNAGVSAGVSQQLQQVVQDGQTVTVAPYPYVPYGHGGFGFGFFGIFFWIIGFFLVIGLIRAAFGWGRGGRRGPGGWGRSGYGYGRGGWSGSDRVADWHRELHRREESTEAGRGDDKPSGSTT